ncbi:glycosyltransferase family 4 protein [Kiritimatiellota bacterium B12222]|nr:glycosyltransferase family 4 protein [Kiritimatiellota bacterium B12222]
MSFWKKASPVDLAVFHEFAPPPTGGGHQFMRALCAEFEKCGLRLEYNQLSKGTPNCLCNSFNFDLKKLRRSLKKHPEVHCVHRVDGPLQTYRGFDDGTDAQISSFNREFADVTVVQSTFSQQKHLELGMSAVQPVLIGNTPDPSLFHRSGKIPFETNRKVRILSSSWSDNPNKGLAIYQWIDQNLDFDRVDYTFVGRLQAELTQIRHLDPMPSEPLADLLRQQDIYLTASRHDPCSNSLVEAMACGLPVLYLNSGGHAELAGEAGIPFENAEEIPQKLDQLISEYAERQAQICITPITEIADKYMALFR